MYYYFEVNDKEIKIVPFSETKKGIDGIIYLPVPSNLQHLAAIGRELPLSPQEVASKIYETTMYRYGVHANFSKIVEKYEKLGVRLSALKELLPEMWSEARSLVASLKEKEIAHDLFTKKRQEIVSTFIAKNPPIMKISFSDYSWDITGELAVYENYNEMAQKMASIMPEDICPFGIGSLEDAAEAAMADHWDDGGFDIIEPPKKIYAVNVFYSGHWEVSFHPDGQIKKNKIA